MPKTILILAANPKNTTRLRLDEEVRDIANGLKRAKRRDEFILRQIWAVRPNDIRRAMLDYKPNIVHFCGHGEGEDGIALEDGDGTVKSVSTQALAGLFEIFQDSVECVLLNACYAAVQAKAIGQHIDTVIGMDKAVSDSAAIEFSVAFYDAVGAGETYDFAYQLGCNAIQMSSSSEHITPVLFKKKTVTDETQDVKSAFRATIPSGMNINTFELTVSPPEPDEMTGIVLPDEAIQYFSDRMKQKKLVIMVGASASVSAGMPLWKKIGDELKRILSYHNPDLQDIPQLAAIYTDELNKSYHNRLASKAKLIQLIENILFSSGFAQKPGFFGEIYPRLAQLPVFNYYTTNWDQLLSQVLMQNHTFQVERLDNQTVKYNQSPATEGIRHVVHLHGTIPGPLEQIIVTADDYFNFRNLAGNVFDRLVQQFKSDTTMLCIGYSFSDLNVVEYLQKALNEGHPCARVYALFPSISKQDAYNLWKRRKIYPIRLGSKGSNPEKWVCSFLDTLLASLKGEIQPFVPPEPATAKPEPETETEIASLIRRTEARVKIGGLKSPADWFANWPEKKTPSAVPPPSHPLLNSVYVERGLKDSIKVHLKEGKNAGITGLLGMGGVGKTYTAMKIAQEMHADGWQVAWVGLLQQGTEGALDLLARAYRLDFVHNLRIEEKIIALKYLFEEIQLSGGRHLVILDNAEKFPNLPLLLEPLTNIPVLVTSRTEECRDLIEYQRLESMDSKETMEFCKLFLDKYDEKRFEKLSSTDKSDLKKLCDHLGGHPLGIRLALAGFIRLSQVRKNEKRIFSKILDEIRARGLEVLPESHEPNTGKAGESIHNTIYSTFEFLFRELPEISDSIGEGAKLLLPVIAALAVVPIDKKTISEALKTLLSYILEEEEDFFIDVNLNHFFPTLFTQAKQPEFNAIRSFLKNNTYANKKNTINSLKNELEGIKKRGQSPLSEYITRISQNLNILIRQLKSHEVKDESNPLEIIFAEIEKLIPGISIDLIKADFLLATYISTLAPFTSLSKKQTINKVRILMNTDSNLDATRIDKLFECLLMSVSKKNMIETKRREFKIRWIDEYILLTDTKVLDRALELLSDLALLDATDDAGIIRVHPLIREFAFEERIRAENIVINEKSFDILTYSGPTLNAVYRCALDSLTILPASGESLLDLLPRLKREISLADTACRKVFALRDEFYYKQGNWSVLRELLEKSVELAQEAKLKESHGRLLADLGELLDRMEYPEGLEKMRESLAILSSINSDEAFKAASWTTEFVDKKKDETEMHNHVRSIMNRLRSTISDERLWQRDTIIEFIEGHLQSHVGENFDSLQYSIGSKCSTFLPNLLLELLKWFEIWYDPVALKKVEALYKTALEKATNGKSTYDVIDPEVKTNFEFELLIAHHKCGLIKKQDFDDSFDRLLNDAIKAGICGLYFQSQKLFHQWRDAVINKKWSEAVSLAKNYFNIELERHYHNKEYRVMYSRIIYLVSQAAMNASDPKQVAIMETTLSSIEKKARFYGKNDHLGWILLGHALLNANKSRRNYHLAVKALVQSRKAFCRMQPQLQVAEEILFKRTIEIIDSDKPIFENIREKLTPEEVAPPDFRPWHIDRKRPFPQRIKCKKDGKWMRLVEGGLQCGPFNKEVHLYPFYIDEEPVSVIEFNLFLQEIEESTSLFGEKTGKIYTNFKTACKYAEWTGKKLPNVHEWYAAKWQLGFGNKPETWNDWDIAKAGKIKRIQAAIEDKIENPHSKLPEKDYEDNKSELGIIRRNFEFHSHADWIKESNSLDKAFQERILTPINDNQVGFSKEDAKNLAIGLATSISLSIEEKKRIVTEAPLFSIEQLKELNKIFREEREKFLDLSQKHSAELENLCSQHRAEMINWLENASSVITFTTTNKFSQELTWSGMIQKQECEKPKALFGNPFSKSEWINKNTVDVVWDGTMSIGIRCVLPLFTSADFDLLNSEE